MEKRVKIPTSELGKNNETGTVIEAWSGHVKVLWDSGSIGIYTIDRHTIEYQ